jgi:hypothetical protein
MIEQLLFTNYPLQKVEIFIYFFWLQTQKKLFEYFPELEKIKVPFLFGNKDRIFPKEELEPVSAIVPNDWFFVGFQIKNFGYFDNKGTIIDYDLWWTN